jgi:hypothetical protein
MKLEGLSVFLSIGPQIKCNRCSFREHVHLHRPVKNETSNSGYP